MNAERKLSDSNNSTMSDQSKAEHVIGLVKISNSEILNEVPQIKREVLSDESEQEFVENASEFCTKTVSANDDNGTSHHGPDEHPSEKNVTLGSDFSTIKLEMDRNCLDFDSNTNKSSSTLTKDDTNRKKTSRKIFTKTRGLISTSQKKSKLLKKRSKKHYYKRSCVKNSSNKAPTSNDEKSYRPSDEELATLTCADCGKKFHKRYNLCVHKMRQAPQSVWRFSCSYCERRFTVKYELKMHLRFVHDVEMTSVKQECDIKTEDGSLNLYQPSAEELATLTCSNCNKRFATRRILCVHKLRHAPKNEWNFPCSLCDKRFIVNKDLKRHIRSAHSDEAPFECTICHNRFKLKPNLNQHMKVHDEERSEFHCAMCTKTFKEAQLLDNHVKYTHRNITCVACKLVFHKVTLYRKHYEETHTSNTYGSVNCSRCEQKFENKHLYEQHLTSHVGEPNFQLCLVCFNIFELPWSLRIHSGLHEDITANKESCPLCALTFTTFRSLKRHLFAVHAADNLKTCPVCEIEFESESWKKHIQAHVERSLFACSVCGKAYATKSSLIRHVRNVYAEKPTYFCEQCSDSVQILSPFKCCYDVMEHVTNEHGSKPMSEIDSTSLIAMATDPDMASVSMEDLVCAVCGWVGADMQKLKAHQARHEPKEKQFPCDQCGRIFSRIKSLKSHVRLTHNADKCDRVSCEVCGKSFVHRSNLKRHLVTHQGVKAFSCHICAQTFTQKVSLNTHLMAHDGIKPHQCEFCDKCFTQKSNRKSHMKRCSASPHGGFRSAPRKRTMKSGGSVKEEKLDLDVVTPLLGIPFPY